MTWLLDVLFLIGYWFCFQGAWYLYKAGPTYNAALAGNYTPINRVTRVLVIVASYLILLLTLATAKWANRWATILLLAIGVGLVATACSLSDHAGTNHSRYFLRGIGDRMIKSGDIADLKSLAAAPSIDPEKFLSPSRREALKHVLNFFPDYSIDSPCPGVVIVSYGRIVEVMVGPDTLKSPVGWDASRAVNVAPGVFVIGGENEW